MQILHTKLKYSGFFHVHIIELVYPKSLYKLCFQFLLTMLMKKIFRGAGINKGYFGNGENSELIIPLVII